MSGRLFVVGDTHGQIDIHKLTTKSFPLQKELDKNDIMFILGDSALCWDGNGSDRYIQNWFSEKNFTTISLMGNHENHILIQKLPIVEKYGGRLHQIKDNVFYAINGEIYTIANKTILCIGGADSTDKELRKEGISWWPQEAINIFDMRNAFNNLEKHNFKVDYVFSHTGGTEINSYFGFKSSPSDKTLDRLLELGVWNKNYKHYCGHLHRDCIVSENKRVVFNDIIEL
jgi:predicted phosphodiesterase